MEAIGRRGGMNDYFRWEEAVADPMASPREGARHDALFPRIG